MPGSSTRRDLSGHRDRFPTISLGRPIYEQESTARQATWLARL